MKTLPPFKPFFEKKTGERRREVGDDIKEADLKQQQPGILHKGIDDELARKHKMLGKARENGNTTKL